MKATLLLGLAFDWTTEGDYATHLNETLERMRQIAFVDTTLSRTLSDGKAHLQLLATFDYEDEYEYASKLVEVIDYAREYGSAELRIVKRGTGIAAEGHLMHPTMATQPETQPSEHPELDKLHAAREAASDAIGQFIDWLGEHGYTIASWQHATYRIEPKLAVYDQDAMTQKGRKDIWHRSISKLEPALCGAKPKPFNVRGHERTAEGWFGYFGVYSDPPRLAACSECERMYETGEWPERQSVEPQLLPARNTIEQWLAEYFGIDLAKVEQERRAILESLRA